MPLQQLTNDQVLASLERRERVWNADELKGKVPLGLERVLSMCWDNSPNNRSTFSAIAILLSELGKDEYNHNIRNK